MPSAGNLHNQHVFVFVHDEAAQEIALRIHDAERCGSGHVPLPDGERGADAFLEKLLGHLNAFRRKDADIDLGAGIVEAHAEQPLAVVFDLHKRTVNHGRGEAEDFAVKNQRMAGDKAVAFARLQKDSWQRFHSL